MREVPPRHYLDNAATSYPKPPGVADAVRDYIEHVGASAGRGAYREALESQHIIDDCRAALRQLLRTRPDDHVLFTLNGTDSLNLVLKGLVRPGDHVVTTAMDHNSVLRPLAALQARGQVEHTIVPVDPHTTRLTADDIAAALRPETRLVAINHASNVTGVLQPVKEVAALCRERGVICLVDAAQSAGHVPIEFAEWGFDALATPGHKGLLGPLGTGVLVLRDGLEQQMETWREGGTGSQSESLAQPDILPDRFETGSHNAPGIAGLLVAVRWLLEQGLDALRAAEMAHCEDMIAALDACPGLRFFGPRDPTQRVGVFSVRIDDYEPIELSALLEQQYELLTRSGLHCAPLAHRTIGTLDSGGTTRLSLGARTTDEDVEAACTALVEIAAGSSTVAINE